MSVETGTAYFDRSYIALYAMVLLNKLGDSVFSFYVAGYLYSIGIPLAGVILFFGCEFGLRGILSPLGAVAVARFGVARALLMAGAASSTFFLALGASSSEPGAAFACFALYALSRAIYHPCKHALNATLVDNAHRGRQQTMELVVASTGAAIGAAVAGTVIARNSFVTASTVAAILSLTSSLPFFCLLRTKSAHAYPVKVKFSEPYRFLMSSEFRHNLIPFYGEAATIIARVVAVPLFLFLATRHFDTVGLVIGAALLVEVVITLWHGQRIDKAGNSAAIARASWPLSVVHIAYTFVAKTSLSAFIVQMALQVTNNMFASAWNTRIHRDIQASSNPLVYAATKELWLCLSELVLLATFAAMARYIGENVFYVMFGAGAVGAHIVRRSTGTSNREQAVVAL